MNPQCSRILNKCLILEQRFLDLLGTWTENCKATRDSGLSLQPESQDLYEARQQLLRPRPSDLANIPASDERFPVLCALHLGAKADRF